MLGSKGDCVSRLKFARMTDVREDPAVFGLIGSWLSIQLTNQLTSWLTIKIAVERIVNQWLQLKLH